MHTNHNPLLENGIFYPLRVARHQQLMIKIFRGKEDAGKIGDSLNKRADEHLRDIHSLVMSDEDISTRRDLSPLQPFMDHFDVKIIFSMRRQDLWLESWYFQNIKWQWNPKLSHCTFEEFLNMRSDFHWIDYDGFVSKLAGLFGAENILLNVFEKEQMPGGPVRTFCRQIGLTNLAGFSDPPHVNSSMSAEMVEFVRHMPLDQFAPPERDLLRRAFEKLDRTVLGYTGKQSELLLSWRKRKQILGEYTPGNQALAEQYFGRGDLFQEPLPSMWDPLAKLEIPKDSETLLSRFVSPLLQQLVESGTISRAQGKK